MIIKRIPICPFLGKPCIGDGFTRQSLKEAEFYPCAFYDDESSDSVEPCRIRRAINRINGEDDFPSAVTVSPDVPFDYDRKNIERK